MEDCRYIVGEPLFDKGHRDAFYIPVGQADLARNILKKIKSAEEVVIKLREEYLAIILAMKRMGISFRIIYAHGDKIDEGVLSTCVQTLGCRLIGLNSIFFPSSMIYPRDFMTVIDRIILINSQMVTFRAIENDDYKLVSSHFGEGGRVLHCGGTMLVGERFIIRDGITVDSREEVAKIRGLGINVGMLPLPLAQVFSREKKEEILTFNDHWDRPGCLIMGKDNEPHLIVDPCVCTANYETGSPWVPRLPGPSLEVLKRQCDLLGIQVHCPKRMNIPYSLNLVQFSDGRVLMTDGDYDVEETIGGIVGREKVYKTPIPIEMFPVWCYAGIHCLINDAPQVLFKKVDSL